MKREGSPWTGVTAVWAKELADHLSSTRMRVLEILVLVAAVGAVYVAGQQLRATVMQDPFAFLRLFTAARAPLPSFVAFLGFFVPLVAIALGFDAVNGEYNRRTLSRILSQPIYRDALLLGKFLAALSTLAVLLAALWLVTTGLGILFLGLPPGPEEVARGLLFLLATLFYGGVWLALALCLSVVFRQPQGAVLTALGVWIFFAVLWPMLTQFLVQGAQAVATGMARDPLAQVSLALGLARVSPNALYSDVVQALLQPEVRTLGPVFLAQLDGMIIGRPLPLAESLALVWPAFTALVAGTLLLFALAYVLFQRKEVRA